MGGHIVTLGGCPRATYLRLKGRDGAKKTAKSQWIMGIGKAVERMYVNWHKENGSYVANNVKFYLSEVNLSGEVDLFTRSPWGGLEMSEVKTLAGYYAEKEIFGNKSTLGKPKPAHLLQIILYLWRYQVDLNVINRGFLEYVDRGMARRNSFEVRLEKEGSDYRPYLDSRPVTEYTLNDIRRCLVQLDEYVKRDELPPPGFKLIYTPEEVEFFYRVGNIPKTRYMKWKKDPEKEPCGDWNCRRSYCVHSTFCYPQGKASAGEEIIEAIGH